MSSATPYVEPTRVRQPERIWVTKNPEPEHPEEHPVPIARRPTPAQAVSAPGVQRDTISTTSSTRARSSGGRSRSAVPPELRRIEDSALVECRELETVRNLVGQRAQAASAAPQSGRARRERAQAGASTGAVSGSAHLGLDRLERRRPANG